MIDIVVEIKFRSVNVGIIMIEGELVVWFFYVRRFVIVEVLVCYDFIGVGLWWRNLILRVIYSVLGNFMFWVIKFWIVNYRFE